MKRPATLYGKLNLHKPNSQHTNPIGNFIMAMPKITSLDSTTESINMLVYSDPGAGKTVLGGTVEDGLIVATEPGYASAARFGSKCKVTRPANWNEFEEIVRTAKNGGFDGKFRWLVIDTLTEAQAMCMTQLLVDGKRERPSRDIDRPELQDWMLYQNRFKRVVKALNDAPINVLYLCHAMDSEDEDGETIILPAIAGKNGTNDRTTMSKWVCGTVHAYGYLKVTVRGEGKDRKVSRRLICERSGPYFGKDRYNVLTPYVLRPNMASIESKILGTDGTDEDTAAE